MFEIEPHRFVKYRVLPWPVCRCGLVYMKNPFTQWCVDRGCNHKDHPDYKRVMHEFTKHNGPR